MFTMLLDGGISKQYKATYFNRDNTMSDDCPENYMPHPAKVHALRVCFTFVLLLYSILFDVLLKMSFPLLCKVFILFLTIFVVFNILYFTYF